MQNNAHGTEVSFGYFSAPVYAPEHFAGLRCSFARNPRPKIGIGPAMTATAVPGHSGAKRSLGSGIVGKIKWWAVAMFSALAWPY